MKAKQTHFSAKLMSYLCFPEFKGQEGGRGRQGICFKYRNGENTTNLADYLGMFYSLKCRVYYSCGITCGYNFQK
jgi:hypothetical protein